MSYDSSYRFSSESELEEALCNRIIRACKDVEKLFDSGHSAKLSRQAVDYYAEQLNNNGIQFRTSDLKSNLEIILMSDFKHYDYDDYIDMAQISENYGKYAYNIDRILRELQSEIQSRAIRFSRDAYTYVKDKYL
jgi:hypothetical protein